MKGDGDTSLTSFYLQPPLADYGVRTASDVDQEFVVEDCLQVG